MPRQQTHRNFTHWIRRFDRHLEARNYSPITRRYYRYRLGYFAEWLDQMHETTTPKEVQPEHLGDYQAYLVDQYRKPTGGRITTGTQMQRLAPLKAFFRWMTERGTLPANPTLALRLPIKSKTLPRDVPTVREVGRAIRRLLRTTHRHRLRNAALVGTLFASGARKMEVARLTVADVDLQSREVRIEKAKNRQGRLTFITPWCAELITGYLSHERPRWAKPDSQRLFLSTTGKGVSASRLDEAVRNAFAFLRDKRVGCHALRHAFCVSLLRGGANVRVIAELAGHRRLASTSIYTRLELADLRKVHEKAFR